MCKRISIVEAVIHQLYPRECDMFETLALLTVQLFESCDCDIHIVKNRARLNSKETIFYAEEEIAQSTAHLVTPQTDALRRTLFF